MLIVILVLSDQIISVVKWIEATKIYMLINETNESKWFWGGALYEKMLPMQVPPSEWWIMQELNGSSYKCLIKMNLSAALEQMNALIQ